jgi:hypothetical protein
MLGIAWGGASWAEIVTAFGTVLIGSGIVFAGSQVLEVRKSRHADIAIRFAEHWNEDFLTISREAATGFPTALELKNEIKRSRTNEQAKFHLLLRVPNFFEEVGAAERYGWITRDWVCSTWGSAIPRMWVTWLPTVEYLRGPDSTGLEKRRVYREFEMLKDRVGLTLTLEEASDAGRAVPTVPMGPWSGGWLRF